MVFTPRMAIVKEYRCAAHGPFESTRPKCKYGCSPRFVTQEFRTAPAIKSAGTKHLDREIGNLARDYKLTDIRNGEDGESVMQTLRKNPQFAPTWGEVKHAKPGFSQRPGEQAPVFSPASMGATPTGALQQMKPLMTGPKPILAAPAYRPTPT
jgi:hypothetical protein